MAMCSVPTLAAVLASKRIALHSQGVPGVQEARCAWILGSKIRNFVLGAEAAECDAGLVLGAESSSFPLDLTERLFHTLDTHGSQRKLLPIDFKTINLAPCPWQHGSQGEYTTSLNRAQSKCAFVIVQNPAAPHLVAVVPRHMIDRGRNTGDACVRRWRTVPMSESVMEPFPIELTPYVMPIKFLAAGVQAFLDFYETPERGWINPSSNLVVKDIPALELQPVDLLLPSGSSMVQDLHYERELWSAFKKYSKSYHIERLMIKPGCGDLQIVHNISGARVVVEMKSGAARLTQDGTVIHIRAYNSTLDDEWHTPYFSAISSWDYMLTITTSIGPRGRIALFFSRESPPRDWYENSNEEDLSWTPSPSFLASHKLHWDKSDMRPLVRQIEKILDDRRALRMSLNAVTNYAFAVPSRTEVKQLERGDEYQRRIQTPLVTGRATGKGVSHMRTSALREEVLKRQCRQRQFGWIYRLGTHPTSTHVYVPVAWTHEPPLFVELEPEQPVFYINFADIDILDEQNARFRYLTQILHAGAGIGGSLYILFPFQTNLTMRGLHCYIVPSSCLDGKGTLKNAVNRTLSTWRGTRHLPFRLESGEALSVYHCAEQDVVAFLDLLSREWSNPFVAPHGRVGAPGVYGAAYLDEVVTSRVESVRRILEMEMGRTFWNYRIKNVSSPGDVVREIEDEEDGHLTENTSDETDSSDQEE